MQYINECSQLCITTMVNDDEIHWNKIICIFLKSDFKDVLKNYNIEKHICQRLTRLLFKTHAHWKIRK